jgi:hypothetical protein
LKFGHEIIVPMSFGGQPTADNMTTFTRGNDPLPAVPRVWTLSWRDKDRRAALVPIEVAMHYFGDWRASSDREAVRNGLVPSLDLERGRVAMVWGDYLYSGQHGMYSTVKIDVPRVPHVLIEHANENGATVGDWKYRPWDFFKWGDMLDPKAAQYRKAIQAQRGVLDLVSSIDDSQLDQLAELLSKRKSSAKGA